LSATDTGLGPRSEAVCRHAQEALRGARRTPRIHRACPETREGAADVAFVK
jgi:hypothetical protein